MKANNLAISVQGLGKRYMIGAKLRQSDTLGETIATAASHHLGQLRRLMSSGTREPSRRTEDFWALRDVSFDVQPGQALGIIGRNGSGKSTLLKILARITNPTEGQAAISGRVGSLLEIGTGFHGELTGRENIFLSGTILGMKHHEITKRFDEIVAFSGVEQFVETPVKHYSSGMYLRLAFAVAAHLRTEILLIDEVLAVGDAAFQKKCIDKMSAIANEGRTILFVSHNLGAVSRLCKSGLLLDAGKVLVQGSIGEVVATYGRLVADRDEDDTSAGNSGIEVRGLKVEPAGTSIDPSSQLTFTFRINVAKSYWNLFVQLGITTPDGLHLVLDSIDSDRMPELKQSGQYEVEVVFPALWLRSKNYSSRVKVIAHPESGATERFYSEWIPITIDGGIVADSVTDRILAPRSDWSVRPAASSSQRLPE